MEWVGESIVIPNITGICLGRSGKSLETGIGYVYEMTRLSGSKNSHFPFEWEESQVFPSIIDSSIRQ